MIDDEYEDDYEYEQDLIEEKDAEIKSLKREIQRLNKQLEQTKNERWDAIDKMHAALRKVEDLQKYENTVKLKDFEHTHEIQQLKTENKNLQSQYNKMRSAFDRRKQQHNAISVFCQTYNVQTEDGVKLSLTSMIKGGMGIENYFKNNKE